MAVLLYSPGLSAPFHLDDPNVLQISERPGWATRPLGFASFWLNIQAAHLVRPMLPWTEAFYIRLGNVLIHALAATALFWLTRELLSQSVPAAIAGGLFLVHPIQTQAITYISQRFESQAALFMLLTAGAYVRFRRTRSRMWFMSAAVLATAAGLTKETAVVLPVWIVFIEWIFFGSKGIKRVSLYALPLVLVLLYPAWLAFRGSGTTLTWIAWDSYFLTQGPILMKYFQLLVWPHRQFLFYGFIAVTSFSWILVFQWLLVLGIFALGFYLLKKAPAIGFGILSFFVLLAPVMLLPLPDLINEHRVYAALAGIGIAAGALYQKLNKKWVLGAVAIAAVFLGVRTMVRNAEWNDQIAFLESHRDAFPRDPAILTRLASYYFMRGYVNKAIETNLEARRYEGSANSYYRQQGHLLTSINLATEYMAKGQMEDAKREALRGVVAKPNEPLAWRTLGQLQLQLRDYAGARQSYEKYAALQPNIEAWTNLRIAALGLSDTRTAELAEQRLKEETAKEAAVAPQHLLELPASYKTPFIFGLTLTMLSLIALAVRTVWSAIHEERQKRDKAKRGQ